MQSGRKWRCPGGWRFRVSPPVGHERNGLPVKGEDVLNAQLTCRQMGSKRMVSCNLVLNCLVPDGSDLSKKISPESRRGEGVMVLHVWALWVPRIRLIRKRIKVGPRTLPVGTSSKEKSWSAARLKRSGTCACVRDELRGYLGGPGCGRPFEQRHPLGEQTAVRDGSEVSASLGQRRLLAARHVALGYISRPSGVGTRSERGPPPSGRDLRAERPP